MKQKYLHHILLLLSASMAGSCKEFLTIEAPRDQWITSSIFADDALAKAAVNGIYWEMNSGRGNHFASGGSGSVSVLMGLAADELTYNSIEERVNEFADNRVLPASAGNLTLWSGAYKTLFRANEVLEGLDASASVSAEVARQLRGEALFVRAFCHFYLLNLYGPVPLVLTADYRATGVLPRSDAKAVYGSIEQDLTEAYSLLPLIYAENGGEKVRPVKWTAQAMLARVYLYQQKWTEAEKAASEVIGQDGLYALEADLDKVFLKTSREVIWQILTTASNYDSWEGYEALPIVGSAAAPTYSLSNELTGSFEQGDRRAAHWVNRYTPLNSTVTYTYPFKYKVKEVANGAAHQEYGTVLRLSEQYLIRAEARMHLQNLAGAWEDINRIRATHGGFAADELTSNGDIEAALERERFVEFFHEWGHRWFDLNRWGKADEVLGAVKPNWKPHLSVLPIPQKEIEADPFLTQNEGY